MSARAETPAARHPAPLAPQSGWPLLSRLRIAVLLALFAAVPVVLASWALAQQAAESRAARLDASSNAMLRAAIGEFAETLDEAQRRAERLASSPRVIRALVEGDRATLERLSRSHPHTAFMSGTTLRAGAVPPISVERSVEVIAGERSLGQVAVAVPLDQDLLGRLASAAGLGAGDRLAIAEAGTVLAETRGLRGTTLSLPSNQAQDVRLGDSTYRATAARLVGGEGRTEIVILRPRASTDAATRAATRRVLFGALGAMMAIALLAYAIAPAVARGRLSQQQRAQAATVLSHVGDAVLLVDRDGIVRFWNQAAEVITGLPAERVVGRRLTEAIPGWSTIEGLVPVSARPGELGEAPRATTVPLELEGREAWLSITGVEFADGTVYTFRDLTEERRLDELKTDFVSTVSHELRTPIAAVYGSSVILQERGEALSEGERDELLSIIYQQSDRLARLVDDVLVAGQLASGRLTLVNDTFDPVELARAVIDETPSHLRDGFSIELRAPDSLAPVAGDSTKARQVLSNLVENAIKYSPGGSRVEVALEPRDRFVRFAVRDEGLGIPPNEQNRIFEKFYRVDPQMRQGISGTGLGLYICRELVRYMNGRIWVSSQPGAGSTFFVELPFAREPTAAPTRA